jgi:putative hydrolase of HD superfamily
MSDRVGPLADFVSEIALLKLVHRRAYDPLGVRRENAAEHSWHVALALLAAVGELRVELDLMKALSMALVHDLCEIDAGDTPVYGPERADRSAAEARCMERLASLLPRFGADARELWIEFEAQESVESRWVKVMDRFVPFLVNLRTNGKAWKEQGVAVEQLLRVSAPVRQHAPELFGWMQERIEECARAGWLRRT